MAKDLAIVLNNGSLNSAVTSALAIQKFRLVMIHVQVSDHLGGRRRAAYEQQVAHFKPYREHTVPLGFLDGLGGAVEPKSSTVDPRTPASVTPLLVDLLPAVAVAARFAVHYSATSIYLDLQIGNQTDELAQATEYIQVWQEMLQLTCGQPNMDLQAPLMELEPWQAVDLGFNISAPFDRTWSCSEQGPEPCWACRACRGREAAFQQAGKADPLKTGRKP
jgi:7-cyano-7-deazaguanine synthase